MSKLVAVNEYDYGIESNLFIQFTSSLFQLKELNLKCKTVVEQKLIEFENQIVINVLIGHRFVKQDLKFIKRKPAVGRDDGIKDRKSISTWPDSSSTSPNPYYRFQPRPKSSSAANILFANVMTVNLLAILIVMSSKYQ